MKNSAIGSLIEKPDPGDNACAIRGEAIGPTGMGEFAHDAVDVACSGFAGFDADSNVVADDGDWVEGVLFRLELEVVLKRCRERFAADE